MTSFRSRGSVLFLYRRPWCQCNEHSHTTEADCQHRNGYRQRAPVAARWCYPARVTNTSGLVRFFPAFLFHFVSVSFCNLFRIFFSLIYCCVLFVWQLGLARYAGPGTLTLLPGAVATLASGAPNNFPDIQAGLSFIVQVHTCVRVRECLCVCVIVC